MPEHEIVIQTVNRYSPEIARGIGGLMPQLDPTFSGEPVPREKLEPIINSPDQDLLVALAGDLVIGTGTMNTVRGPGFGARGQLEDVVVDKEWRRLRVGAGLSEAFLVWCHLKGLDCYYLQTETYRPDAIAFYERMGAKLLQGTLTYKVNV